MSDTATAKTLELYGKTRRRQRLILFALLAAVLVLPLVTIAIGPAAVSVGDVIGVIKSHIPGLDVDITWSQNVDAIVWKTRLPRIISGLAIGAILGIAGAVMQAVVRNPLAEPYVLGVSSGASTGAAAMIILFGSIASWSVGLAAFAGALAATLFLLLVTGNSGSSLRLILAGLAANFGFQALTNFIIFSSGTPEATQAVMFWMLGSLARANWSQAVPLIVTALIFSVVVALFGPVLDALSSGDRTAQSVGIEPTKARLAILIPVSAVIGIAVASSGAIGFVGLIIPHVMRSIVGSSHRVLTLGCALAGAFFLVIADTFARIAFAPIEMPIGVITGMVGVPFIVLLVRRMK